MTDTKLPLAAAGSHFTVKAGAGPATHNFNKSLHLATLQSSSYLHPVKQYIDSITSVFDNPTVKKEIKEGGLSASMQKVVWNKIREKHPEITDNVLAKDRIKKIIQHYGKDRGATQTPTATKVGPRQPPAISAPSASISANPISEDAHREAAHNLTSANSITSVQTSHISTGIADLQKKRLGSPPTLGPSKMSKPIIPLMK